MFRVPPSLNVPVAVKKGLIPTAPLALLGVIEIETRFAELTVSKLLPLTDSNEAEIVAVPTFLAVARPLTVIEATEFAEDDQETTSLTFWLLPSENVAVAVNCSARPRGKLGFAGPTLSEVAAALVTVSEAVPEIAPEVAVIVVLPPATPCANPWVGDELPMVAAALFEEVQVTLPVMFCVLLSLKVPVAMNCWLVCGAIVMVAGVTAIETSAGVTVSENVPVTLLDVAVIEHLPAAFAVSIPELETVATELSDEFHCAELVRSCELLSLNVPVAVICCDWPATREAF